MCDCDYKKKFAFLERKYHLLRESIRKQRCFYLYVRGGYHAFLQAQYIFDFAKVAAGMKDGEVRYFKESGEEVFSEKEAYFKMSLHETTRDAWQAMMFVIRDYDDMKHRDYVYISKAVVNRPRQMFSKTSSDSEDV